MSDTETAIEPTTTTVAPTDIWPVVVQVFDFLKTLATTDRAKVLRVVQAIIAEVEKEV